MQLFPIGRIYDFMGQRRIFAVVSLFVVLSSFVSIFYPGLKYGTDFRGGTEVEVAFSRGVDAESIRSAVTAAGFSQPVVIEVDEARDANRFIIRIEEVSTISDAKRVEIERALCYGENPPADTCPPERSATEVRVSPGGDKISVRFRDTPDLVWVKQRMATVAGVSLRAGAQNPQLVNERDHKVDIYLESKGDQLMSELRQRLGADRVPETPLRAEWIGPKAGAQLRDSALKSIVIAVVFVMAYIALRFDIRFAPGAVACMVHDVLGMVGFCVLAHRDFDLITVAAVLTVVGFSVNDTVVIYDRVRENLRHRRRTSFHELINLSLSEMLSRTILANGTAMVSLMAFFFWGTGALKNFALVLIVGITLGTYSSIYVALPLTAWLDRVLFARLGQKAVRGSTISS